MTDRVNIHKAEADQARLLERIRRFLDQEAWPTTVGADAGRTLTRAEENAILGYGEAGV